MKLSEMVVLPKEEIKEMTKRARSKARQSMILGHLISVYILALINEARKEGKDRFSCIISLQKLTKRFKNFDNFFSLLRIEEEVRAKFRQLEVTETIVIQRFNFPQQDYVPTEREFNFTVKRLNGMTENNFLYLNTKLVTIFYTAVVNEATGELLRTEDVRVGDTIPSLTTYFFIENGEIKWIIPKKSVKEEVKNHKQKREKEER